MSAWLGVAQQISQATGRIFTPRAAHLRRSQLNGTAVLDDGERSFFVKSNTADAIDMFRAEAAGLDALASTCTVRVIRPVCWGVADGRSFLVLEHVILEERTEAMDTDLGRSLAALHARHGVCFGWDRDNTIGTTPQPNAPGQNWQDFWKDKRLSYQLRLAARNGYNGRLQELGAAVLTRLSALFSGYRPAPSPLHGDLWSGNAAGCDGRAIVYDPAFYYGDRETDLAMTELFGGFSPAFYAAYQEAYPLDQGYEVRKTLYNLYHVLNHLNLFGGGYLGQAERLMARLVAETGT